MKTIYIWNIKFNPLRKNEIVSHVQEWLAEGRKGIHITGVNPEGVVQAQTNLFLRETIRDSDMVNIDNVLVVLTLRLNGCEIPERAATPDVFELLLVEANKRRQRIYFLGAEENVLRKMLLKIKQEYPFIQIVGAHNGFYTAEEEGKIVKEISDLSPDYLFLGLPTPQKELFIMKYKPILPVGCLYGVGGAFDVKGEKVSRAPKWLRNIGLEGVCRILQNPRNYGGRITTYYFPFLKLFFGHLFSKRIVFEKDRS